MCFQLFWAEKTADLPPHIFRLYAVVINLIGRAIYRDDHFGDVRINVLFRFSGAGWVGFDKKQKNGIEQPALRVGLDVGTAVGDYDLEGRIGLTLQISKTFSHWSKGWVISDFQ